MYNSDLKQLRFEEKLLYSSCISVLNTLKCSNVASFFKKLEEKRNADVKILTDNIMPIQHSILQLFRNVTSCDKLKNADVNEYKIHIQEIYSLINKIKNYISNNNTIILSQEDILSYEVRCFEKQCAAFDTDNFYKSFDSSTIKSKHIKKVVVHKDVKIFQKFLHDNGGHTGNWGDEEHRIFVSFWYKYHLQKYSNQEITNNINDNCLKFCEKFLKSIREVLSGKSIEEIILHILWMCKYNVLKKQQATAIKTWKMTQKINKPIECTSQVVLESEASDHKSDMSDMSDMIPKEEIKEWKQNRDVAMRINIEKRANSAINNRESMNLKHAERKKEIITRWNAMKQKLRNSANEKFKQTENPDQNQNVKKNNINNKLKEFRQRDKAFVNEKLNKCRTIIRSKSLSDVNTSIKNNLKNQLLYRKNGYTEFTKQWTHRIMRKYEPNTEKPYMTKSVETIPKLKTPYWRKGLNMR